MATFTQITIATSSGEIHFTAQKSFVEKHTDPRYMTTRIPAELILKLVAHYIRTKRISELEDMPDEKLLLLDTASQDWI